MEPKKYFWKTTGIALGIVFISAGFAWYLKTDIDVKTTTIKQLHERIKMQSATIQALASLQGDSEKAKQYAAQLDTFLTRRDDLLSFSKDFGLMIQQAGFGGQPKFKDEAAIPGDIQRTGFTLGIDGPKTIDNVAALMGVIEKSRYYVHFNSIDITQDASLHLSTDGYVISFK